MDRRRALLVLGPVLVFVAVTFGIQPAVNFVVRLRSPDSYSQYAFGGTWVAGLVAAFAALGVGWAITQRNRSDG